MEHELEKQVICPYCDSVQEDSYPDEDDVIICDNSGCNKSFNVVVHTEISYSTSRILCEAAACNLKIDRFLIKSTEYIWKDSKWIHLPEDQWKYFRVDRCTNCHNEEYVKIEKEEYNNSILAREKYGKYQE